MLPEGFPRRLRLRRRVDYLRVQKRGAKHHTRHFLVFVAPSGLLFGHASARQTGPSHVAWSEERLPLSRLGVTVTRKVGKAVDRNRIKRLVREAFRRERRSFADGLDLVWVAKRDAVNVGYEAVVADMQTLASRLSRAPAQRSSRPRREGA